MLNKGTEKQSASNRVPVELLWPPGLAKKNKSGFSDSELEALCDWGLRGHDATLPYRSAPWIYWTAELYSFGRCYREWLGLPRWAPLPLYGDHGCCTKGELMWHELQSKSKIHLTWYKDRAEFNQYIPDKSVVRIPHPWITYRRRHGIMKSAQANGTLVFYAHSNNGIEILDYDWDSYFNELKNLSEEFHPLVVCMHRHDVEKGYHHKLRKYGLPIVSAGESSSPYFVDRFYDIISQFEYATSNSGGSELFYCEEMGVKYFLKGVEPVRTNLSHSEVPIGPLVAQDAVAASAAKRKRNLFSGFPPCSSKEKTQFVADILGSDLNESECKRSVLRHYRIELMRHLPEIFRVLMRRIRGRLSRTAIGRFIKARIVADASS